MFYSGAVFKGRWISKKRQVACKVITVSKTKNAEVLEKSFLKELSAYVELSGAYILKTYGFAAFKQDENKHYMLIMEYMSRGNLTSLIKEQGDQLTLRRRVDMARNIASGLRKIHEHGMIHRDIRLDNILVNENYVAKIGDMGIARTVDPLKQHTKIGCQSFMPPEFYNGTYDQTLDIFTFGLTLNQLFTSKQHAFQPLVRDKIAFLEKSPIFDDLISRCTAHDPKLRPTAVEIEKTMDLYSAGFNELVIKQHPSYTKLSTKDKDEIFIAFYEKFHPAATEFIQKEFPPEFLGDPNDMACVKVDKNAGDGIRIECPMQ
jgi:serine/threonine protein kinase